MLQAENVLFTATVAAYLASMLLYFLFAALKKDKLATAAIMLQIVGFALHTAALVCRGIGAGRLPMTK